MAFLAHCTSGGGGEVPESCTALPSACILLRAGSTCNNTIPSVRNRRTGQAAGKQRVSILFCGPVIHLTKWYIRVGSQIAFTPIIRPDPPSLARQLSYQEKSPLIGPDGDPDGWYRITPVSLRGSIFNNRAIEAQLTVSVAAAPNSKKGSHACKSAQLWLAKPVSNR